VKPLPPRLDVLARGSGKTDCGDFFEFILAKIRSGWYFDLICRRDPAKAARRMAGKERGERVYSIHNQRNPLKRLDPAKPIQANPSVFL
jgi:hypothetical protein